MRGTTGFILGVVVGAFIVIVLTILAPASTRESLILDLRSQIAEQQRDIESLRRAVAAPKAAPAIALNPPPPAGPRSLPDSPSATAPMDSPILARRALAADYEEFLAPFPLTSEQRERFLDLATRVGDPATPDGLRELLGGAAGYAAFREYTARIPQRREVRELESALERIAQPLTPTQRQAMLDIIAREQQTFSPPTVGSIATMRSSARARALQDLGRMQQRILLRAGDVLAPEQTEVLRQVQASQFQALRLATELAP